METKDVAITTEVSVSVSRTFNLGNYESVKVEAQVRISRNEDDDTFAKLRDLAIDQASNIIEEAKTEFLPTRRRPPDEN